MRARELRMAFLDRRIKRCPNSGCVAFERMKYGADVQFCGACGAELVFVCRKCGRKIEDRGPKHTICASCEAKRQDRIDTAIDITKNIATGVGTVAAATAAVVVNAPGVAGQVAEHAVEFVDTIRSLRH